jgi:hypothetical protein
MLKTTYIENRGWVIVKDDQPIHLNINIPLNQIEVLEDSYEPYVIFEYAGHFSRLIGIMACSEYDALEGVDTYIRENEPEDDQDPQLLGVQRLDVTSC